MEQAITKYLCSDCAENFALVKSFAAKPEVCPRCGSSDVAESLSCSLEVGPPPWEFSCRSCLTRFAVQSPRGPEEVKRFRCPVCRGKDLKWLALSSAACLSGG